MSSPVILVAVDIAGGRVVRLTRGDAGEATVYRDDPVAAAVEWERQGAGWLHVVDLDAAIEGEPRNEQIIEKILAAVGIPVQVGGGIRTLDAVRVWVERGATRVCLGTKALDREFLRGAVDEFGDRVLPAVDARSGVVRVAGWTRRSGESAVEAASRVSESGAARLMFTDIERDGTLLGPNIAAIEEVLEAAGIPVIASGGVASEEDVGMLAKLAPEGLEGIVIGKALYEGKLSVDGARRAAGG